MKALLVIDIENELEYEAINDYFAGYITLHLGNDTLCDFQDVMLQPMPTKKLVAFDPNNCDIEEEIKIIHEIEGYNRCIDEILGEEE